MAQNGLTFIKRQRTLCLDIKSAANGKTSVEEWMESKGNAVICKTHIQTQESSNFVR